MPKIFAVPRLVINDLGYKLQEGHLMPPTSKLVTQLLIYVGVCSLQELCQILNVSDNVISYPENIGWHSLASRLSYQKHNYSRFLALESVCDHKSKSDFVTYTSLNENIPLLLYG